MKTITKIIFFLLLAITAYSQNLSKNEAENFIQALLNNSEELQNYFDPSEVLLSERLGITYSDVQFKPLISIDLEPQIKLKILDNQLKYEYEIFPLENDFSKLVIKIPQFELKYEYIFHHSKLISKPSYYSRNWARVVSEYFVFHASDSSLTNAYAMRQLDSFVENLLEVLKCSPEQVQKLKEAKIHYFLCKNDAEINNLTGYFARGLYYLANDFIISTFNCHYHEICHLLINYKVHSLMLFTQPLLQEGFAVAFGGRGGKEPNVILNMGIFLIKSNFLDYEMLLSKNTFGQYDASMSYPVAGLFTKFLIQSMGIEKYLKLYTKYTCSNDEIDMVQINPSDLPARSEWENYISGNPSNQFLRIDNLNQKDFPLLVKENEGIHIYANEIEYLIKTKDCIGFKPNEIMNYQSKLFHELFPDSKYQNEKYMISVNVDEISVYNLFTNNMLAKYVKAFSLDNKEVQQENGYFVFSVSKAIFDERLEELVITNTECGFNR